MKHREKERSRGWRTVDDIEWPLVIQLVHRKFAEWLRLFAQKKPDVLTFDIMAFARIEDSVEINLYEHTPDDKIVSAYDLDPNWFDDFAEMNSSFATLLQGLSDDEQENAVAVMHDSLESILTKECDELAKSNFHFPALTRVTWAVRIG